ncbi:MAG: hypothetical protein IPK50_21685 [Fibrobacterota bacterium]|nr:MAG: hypothetical protein IPK50_21685 [Fibrobacterota bacterium]
MRRFLSLIFLATTAFAASAVVPDPLRPWVPWVLRDAGDKLCPTGDGDGVRTVEVSDSASDTVVVQVVQERRCLAVSEIALMVDKEGSDFRMSGWRWTEGSVHLPHATDVRVVSVRQAGKPVAVLSDEAGQPHVVVAPGPFRIEGRLAWKEVPHEVVFPGEAALVTVRRDGKVVDPGPDRGRWKLQGDESGRAKMDSSDAVKIRVFRTFTDGVPFSVKTRLLLDVSGKQRSLVLRSVVLAGSIPTRMESDLPVRLDPDGTLEIAVRPGSHELELEALWFSPPQRVVAPTDSAPWPQAEIWSFLSAPGERTIELSGGMAVDASQAGAASADAHLPSRRLADGEAMEFHEILRGDPRTDSVKSSCEREVWVDFSGKGMVFRDKLTSHLNRPLRLSVAPPYRLGSASHQGQGIALTSITGADQGFPVEGEGSITLVSRAESALWKALPVSPVGWPLDESKLQIHLGPGWRLLAVPGASLTEGTWAGKWDLWKIFVVVLVVSLVVRLVSKTAAVLALVGLGLGCHDGVPFIAWIAFLVALALHLAIAERWPDRVASKVAMVFVGICSVVLLVVQLVFLGSQMRLVAHPELAVPGREYTLHWEPGSMDRLEESREEVRSSRSYSSKQGKGITDELADVLAGNMSYRQNGSLVMNQQRNDVMSEVMTAPQTFSVQDEDPNLFAGVDPGQGVPQWSPEAGSAQWPGFVRADQSFRILALAPGWMRLWRILAVLATTISIGYCLRKAFPAGTSRMGRVVFARATTALIVLAAAGASRAEIPTSQVLDQLREELLRPPVCGEQCAALGEARLRMDGSRAVLELDVQAHAKGRVRLPRPQWLQVSLQVPRGVAGGGKESDLAWVEPGFQTIRMEGLVETDELLVRFPDPTRGIQVVAPGWTVVSTQDDAIHLQRTAQSGESVDGPKSGAERRLADPPSIRRQFQFGREWTVTTSVSRRGTSGSVAVAIPLLAGETPLDPVVQREGKVQAVIAPGSERVEWKSRLPVSPRLLLRAGTPGVASERWLVQSSVRWHLVHRGLAPVESKILEWAPRPGDSLEILFQSPKPVLGAGVLVESSRLKLSGEDLNECQLDLVVATAVGDSFRIALPPGANIRSLEVGSSALPPTYDAKGRLRLELRPGSNTIHLVWVGKSNGGIFRRAPQVVLSAAGVDATMEFPNEERGWILAMGGPGDGPAVLWWGLVAALAVLAWLLSRLPGKPLGFWSWFLLLFGTSTVGNWVVWPFVVWVVAVVARRFLDPSKISKEVFNLLQVLLGGLSVVAFVVLLSAIPVGLLGNPDSGVAGGQGSLGWYVDRFQGELPRPWMVVVPLLAWKALLLCWSLWLVKSLLRWVPWGWESFTMGSVWLAGTRKASPSAQPTVGSDQRTTPSKPD